MSETILEKKLRVKLVKSISGRLPKHIACARGLGLSRLHQTVELPDTPAVRGMVRKISYLLEVLG